MVAGISGRKSSYGHVETLLTGAKVDIAVPIQIPRRALA